MKYCRVLVGLLQALSADGHSSVAFVRVCEIPEATACRSLEDGVPVHA
jgi:hypothetical protein